jgi:integrase
MSGLGSIRRRGKRSFEVRFDVAREEPGRRKRRHVTVRGEDVKDAQEKLVALLRERDTGSAIDPSKTTLGQYLDAWLDEIQVEPKTLERYRQLVTHQIKPHLGSVILQELKPAAVKSWQKTLRERGGVQRRKGEDGKPIEEPRPLADRTCLHAHRTLAKALKDAKAVQLIASNPAADIPQPKVRVKKRIEILTAGQPRQVLDALAGHELYSVAALALATGMRRGELLALRWADCDLDKGAVRVERSLEELQDGSLRFKPPKTKAGERTIAIPAMTVQMLREHRVGQLKQRMQLGLGKEPADALVFPALDGSPMSPDRLSWRWRNTCKSLGLPRVGFHALRHTHASALIAAKEDVVKISRRLGHGSPTVTLNVYAHLFETDDSSAALAIARVLG